MKTIQTLTIASYKLISRGDVLLQVFDPLPIVAIKVIIQASDHCILHLLPGLLLYLTLSPLHL